MRPAIFLDRDGVLNRAYTREDGKSHPPDNVAELELLEGAAEACLVLRRAGFLLIGVTNQPDVARGSQVQEVVEAINNVVKALTLIDEILTCFHDNPDNCDCRKPKPGMLLQAAMTWQIDCAKSFMIGDRWTDIEAGRRAGCKTVLVNAPSKETLRCRPDFRAANLLEAASWILEQYSPTNSPKEENLR